MKPNNADTRNTIEKEYLRAEKFYCQMDYEAYFRTIRLPLERIPQLMIQDILSEADYDDFLSGDTFEILNQTVDHKPKGKDFALFLPRCYSYTQEHYNVYSPFSNSLRYDFESFTKELLRYWGIASELLHGDIPNYNISQQARSCHTFFENFADFVRRFRIVSSSLIDFLCSLVNCSSDSAGNNVDYKQKIEELTQQIEERDKSLLFAQEQKQKVEQETAKTISTHLESIEEKEAQIESLKRQLQELSVRNMSLQEEKTMIEKQRLEAEQLAKEALEENDKIMAEKQQLQAVDNEILADRGQTIVTDNISDKEPIDIPASILSSAIVTIEDEESPEYEALATRIQNSIDSDGYCIRNTDLFDTSLMTCKEFFGKSLHRGEWEVEVLGCGIITAVYFDRLPQQYRLAILKKYFNEKMADLFIENKALFDNISTVAYHIDFGEKGDWDEWIFSKTIKENKTTYPQFNQNAIFEELNKIWYGHQPVSNSIEETIPQSTTEIQPETGEDDDSLLQDQFLEYIEDCFAFKSHKCFKRLPSSVDDYEPDFVIELKAYGETTTFAVATYYQDKPAPFTLSWDFLKEYRKYAKKISGKLYFVLGQGGTPNQPKYLNILPLSIFKKETKLTSKDFKPYRCTKTQGEFYYNIATDELSFK